MGFSGQLFIHRCATIDDEREPCPQTRRGEDLPCVLGRGHDCLPARPGHRGDRGATSRPGIGHDAIGQVPVEQLVLVVAHGANGVVAGRIGGVALGQRDSAGRQERAHAVVAGFAVDVREVVGRGVREVGEQCAPGPLVDLGGRGDDPVQIEQHRVEGGPVEPGSDRAGRVEARADHRGPNRGEAARRECTVPCLAGLAEPGRSCKALSIR